MDFDPHSLRHVLPQAGRTIQQALQQQQGRVYVHCTAGLGRAPAACIAHAFWFSKQQMEEVSLHLVCFVRAAEKLYMSARAQLLHRAFWFSHQQMQEASILARAVGSR